MHFIGADISKLTIDIAYFDEAKKRWSKPCKLKNIQSGWNELIRTVEKQTQARCDSICVVMEATGVYHLKVAAYLSKAGLNVIVANPGRSAQYAKSQNQDNKTDPLDAKSLQRYGANLEKFHLFTPDSPEISELKTLLSRMRQLNKDLQRERNRLEKCGFLEASALLSTSLKRSIRIIIKEQKWVQAHIDKLIASNAKLERNQQLMCSIKGIGKITSQWLLPLLSDQRFNSAREVGAFLGLAPCHKTSGTTLKTRGKLTGRGNADLRARLYMPAISAATTDPEMRAFYQGLIAKGKPKQLALIAVMRKLAHLCYGVVKNQIPYEANYAT